MKYKFNNQTFPPINSVILVVTDNTSHLCVVDNISNGKINTLMLDKNGLLSINLNDNWLLLSVTTLDELRNYYNLYIK